MPSTSNLHIGKLWVRWVAANAIGELFGLGLTAAAIGLAFSQLGETETVAMVLLSFFLAVAGGAIEASIVGLAQWWAMHPWLPAITRTSWWLATLAGALLAYVLGFLPSTLMNLGQDASQPAMDEPAQWIILLLAAGMGLVAGAVLSFAQWIVLRRHVLHAGLWIPANMLAWAVGMPLIFWAIDAAQRLHPIGLTLFFLALCLLVTGAVVGAINGLCLVWLVRSNPRTQP